MSRLAVLCLLLATCAVAVPIHDSLLGMCKITDEGKYKDAQSLVQLTVPEPAFGIPNDHVAELTSANIQSIVHPINQATVVNIFAPWCPVSQAFEPMFNEVAEKMATRADVKFLKVNGDNDIDLRHMFGVDAYPTLLVIKKGSATVDDAVSKPFIRYNGRKTTAELLAWVDKMSHVDSVQPGNEAMVDPLGHAAADTQSTSTPVGGSAAQIALAQASAL
eukprot:c5706_g1_i1.p1 GENE.c5706_g1_i1~~c5706_g1_i1.p1  ORF type:complete len:219 (-),score=62.13 c5706_g1_i1:263-919(-)